MRLSVVFAAELAATEYSASGHDFTCSKNAFEILMEGGWASVEVHDSVTAEVRNTWVNGKYLAMIEVIEDDESQTDDKPKKRSAAAAAKAKKAEAEAEPEKEEKKEDA